MNTNVADIYELTPLQQGMLYHTLSSPESTVYNMQMEFKLEGELDVDALEQSWNLIVKRHDTLRTSFVWAGVEKPYQVVHQSIDSNIARHDWREMDHSEQSQRITTFVSEDRAHLFDLTKPSLIRLSLITLDEHRYLFVWTFHHIVLEGWSASILAGEFWKIYNELCSHRLPELPPVHRYAEYISWLKQQDQARTEAYWRKKLKGFRTPASLPIDKASANEVAQVVNVDQCSDNLSQDQTLALRELARKNRVTLNTIVQGLWAILLARYTGETDVIFGAALSGRPSNLPGVESIVGLFVNVLPVRVEINPDDQLIPWLQKLQLDQAEMRQYEYSSLMQVNSWSELPSGQPLFNTILGFENWLGELPSGPVSSDLKIADMGSTSESDQPLTLFATIASTVSLTLMYDLERFEGSAVKRMLVHFRVLLEAILADPNRRISELPIISENERLQMLVEWNATRTDYPHDKTVHELFEAQVTATPGTVAVDYNGQQLSYRQLNEQANRLAHYLRSIGVGPEVMVGIMAERSPEMVVGLLGILKAGGAYVPLDPDYPKPRLGFMLDDAQAPVLLTLSALKGRLPDFTGTVVCLDTDWPDIEQASVENPEPTATANNLAYVIYTSGSTGQPKGTCIEHHSVVRLVKETNYVELGPEEVFLQYAPISFDASTFELWGSLLNGAKLVVSPAEVLSLEELGRVIQENGVTTLWLTSALFSLMVDHQLPKLLDVRQLLAGGETLSVSHVQKLLDQLGDRRFINGYGPTENTTFTCCHVMTASSNIEHSVPIGRPISNTTVYILDRLMNPVPIGVPGELYIGGDGLARGYLKRDELTAEKFVVNPFSDDPQARLYRTGDRVRYRSDGAVEFLGRFDHQVKIRGFRIELGEVEAALAEHPEVSQSVVIVNDDIDKDRRLFAYTIPESESHPEAEDIREFLRQRLPVYMIPANVIWLDEFPLTPNSKIDYRALPAPPHSHKRTSISNKPETELEIIMANIWQEALDIDDIETNDMFFDLGGHSLLSIKVVEKFAEETGIRLSPLNLLNQTLRQLVAGLEPSVEVTKNTPGKGFFGALKKNIPKRG